LTPSTWVAVLVVVVAVLPGSTFTWAYERQASAFGVTFADRTLRFIAISLIFHLVLGWPEYALYRLASRGSSVGTTQFAAGWAAAVCLVMIPAGLGTILGGLYATRNTREGWSWARKCLTVERERWLLRMGLGRTPAPRAWDDLFSDRPLVYLRVRTQDGSWLAGRFANASYAGGFPNTTDLLLEEAWEVDAEGLLGDRGLGYPVYIPENQIAWLEVIGLADSMEEAARGWRNQAEVRSR
jgi:Family of unknown function (DUF6338)